MVAYEQKSFPLPLIAECTCYITYYLLDFLSLFHLKRCRIVVEKVAVKLLWIDHPPLLWFVVHLGASENHAHSNL